MSNDFYESDGTPATGSFASSAAMRTQFSLVEDGFDKMPSLNAGTAVVVNSLGTALSNTIGTLALAGNFTMSGAFPFTGTVTGATTVTFPTSGTLATTTTPSAEITVGATTVSNGMTGRVLYQNGTLLGELATVGSGSVVLSGAPTVTGLVTDTVNGLAITSTAGGTLTIANAATLAFPFTGSLTLGTQSSSRGSLILANTALSAFPVTVQSSNTTAAAYTITLPTSAGTNGYFLQTDGSGVTAWASAGASGGTTASGSVTLTSASAAAQSITTTAYGQFVKLPDATTMAKGPAFYNVANVGPYPLKVLDNQLNLLGFIPSGKSSIIGCADSGSAAGVWVCASLDPIAVVAKLTGTALHTATGGLKTFTIDSDRDLHLFGCSTDDLYGVIYRKSDTTWGTPTLIRSGAANATALCYTTDRVLVTSLNATTAFQAVVLTVSGVSFTVGTAATATNTGNINTAAPFGNGIIAVGSSYLVAMGTATPAIRMRAMTVSGTTVTIGAETALDGTGASSGAFFGSSYIVALTSTTLLAVSYTVNTAIYSMVYTISAGTTITPGTGTTTASANIIGFYISPISSAARNVVLYVNNAGTGYDAGVISVSGTTSTISVAASPALTTGLAISNAMTAMLVDGSKAIAMVGNGANCRVNVITDTAGTCTVGTAISYANTATGGLNAVRASNNIAVFASSAASNKGVTVHTVDYSGASPAAKSVIASWESNTNSTGYSGPTNGYPYDCTRNGGQLRGSTNAYFLGLGGAVLNPANMGILKVNGTASAQILFGLQANDVLVPSGGDTKLGDTSTPSSMQPGYLSTQSWVFSNISNVGGATLGTLEMLECATV